MPEFLRDSSWQSIGALVGLVAIIVTVALYRLQRRRKSISYEVVSLTPLLSVKEEVRDRVQILFDGKDVLDAHMLIVKVRNSGNVPVLPSDYERSIQFGFGEQTQVMSAEIVETDPSGIDADVSVLSRSVTLRPVLLNAGDAITVRVLLAQYDGSFDVTGRIVGVREIGKTRLRPPTVLLQLVWFLLTVLVSFVLDTVVPQQPPIRLWSLAFMYTVLGAMIGFDVWRDSKSRLQEKRDRREATEMPSETTGRRREGEVYEHLERNLENWEYKGEWSVQDRGDGPVLVVTSSGKGGICRHLLLWTDYVFEFETKIVEKNTSWIIRAKDANSYVMLQCQQNAIYPHFMKDGRWTNLDWTKQNPVSLPFTLPLGTWFGVRVEVRGMQVMAHLTLGGKQTEVLNSVSLGTSLLEPPVAPAEYTVGSVGFRESGNECAHFRSVCVRRI
jgi:hypothetical protein